MTIATYIGPIDASMAATILAIGAMGVMSPYPSVVSVAKLKCSASVRPKGAGHTHRERILQPSGAFTAH